MKSKSLTAIGLVFAAAHILAPVATAQQLRQLQVEKVNYSGWRVEAFNKEAFTGYLFPNGPGVKDGASRIKLSYLDFADSPRVLAHDGDFVQLLTLDKRLVWVQLDVVSLKPPPTSAPIRTPSKPIKPPSRTSPGRSLPLPPPPPPPPPRPAAPSAPMKSEIPKSGSSTGGVPKSGGPSRGIGAPSAPKSAKTKPAPGLSDVASLEIVTDLLSPDQDYRPAEGELPRGVVLLDRQSYSRNALLCDAFTRELRTHEEALAESPDKEFFVTSWLTAFNVTNAESCGELMNAYDYARAETIKAEFGLDGVAGPVLLAVDDKGDSVFLDLSGADDAHISSAITQWLTLALDASEDEDAPVADAAARAAPVDDSESRFSLSSLYAGIRERLLEDEGAEMTPVSLGGAGDDGPIQLFAYEDRSTGYRIGSTIRF